LVAGVVAAGFTVDVRTSGDLAALPQGVSLTAYRVVQEALTNVVRHAEATTVRVVVDADSSGVIDLSVENDPGHAVTHPRPAGGGHGLTGMRERVELYGGSLRTGPTPDGGWRVAARLPSRTDLS